MDEETHYVLRKITTLGEFKSQIIQKRWFFRRQWIAIYSLPIMIFSLQILYVSPVFRAAVKHRYLGPIYGSEIGPLLRSSIFALAAIVIEVFGGFWAAVFLQRITNKLFVRVVGLLLLPALLGPVAVSFLFLRLPWRPSWLLNRPVFETWATILAIEIWQYLPLCLCLYWIRLRLLPFEGEEFAKAHRWSWTERVAHLYWPHCRNLTALLVLFVFFAAFSEFSKTEIILHASAGTDTQFISHWLHSLYHEKAMINPNLAKDLVLARCLALFLPSVLLAALFAVGLPWIGDIFTRLLASHRVRARSIPIGTSTNWARRLFRVCGEMAVRVGAIGVIVLVLAPILMIGRDGLLPSRDALRLFLFSFLVTLPTSLAITAVAIMSGIAVRLAFPVRLQRLNRRSVLCLLAFFVLRAVPAIGLGMCALAWYVVLSPLGSLAISSFWALSELVLIFPLIVVFVICMHCDVSLAEIEFQSASRASLKEVIRDSFAGRFVLSYALAFVFCFAFVWCEDTATRMLSDYVHSATVELQIKVIGRGAEYGEAAALILPTIGLAVFATLVWSRWILTAIDFSKEEHGKNHI